MELITELIMTYLPMYAPAIVAVVGLVATIIPALVKCHEALKAFKEDTTMKDLTAQLQQQSQDNAELVRCNKLLLDRITRIQDYADNKNKEG